MDYDKNEIKKKEKCPYCKRNKIIFTIIIFVLIIAIIYLAFKNYQLQKNSNLEDDYYYDYDEKYNYDRFKIDSVDKESTNNYTSNIEIINAFTNIDYDKATSMDYAYVYGKNNNDKIVEVRVCLKFYDKNKYQLDKSCDSVKVHPNSPFVSTIWLDGKIDYDKVLLTYKAQKTADYYEIVDNNDIEINSSLLVDKTILYTVKNNSNTKISHIEIGCIYYKGDDIVLVKRDDIVEKLNNNDTTSSDIKLKKDIDFDKYELFVISAYNYDADY